MTTKKQPQGKKPRSTPDTARTDVDVDAVAHYFVCRFGTISVGGGLRQL